MLMLSLTDTHILNIISTSNLNVLSVIYFSGGGRGDSVRWWLGGQLDGYLCLPGLPSVLTYTCNLVCCTHIDMDCQAEK